MNYVYLPHRAIIYMLFAYPKGEQPVLTDKQEKRLRPLIDGFKHEH